MPPAPPPVLPGSGNTDLTSLAAALRAAPRALGIANRAEVRTVRIVGDERQYNWGTILLAGGEIQDDAPERISLANGSLVLLRRIVRLAEIKSEEKLIDLLSAWPLSLLEDAGAWQHDHLSVHRSSGDPDAGQLPFWSADLPRQNSPFHNPLGTPPEPYFCPEANFFADRLPVAAGKWLDDPHGSRVWDIKGTTRVVVFDPRAYFTRVEAETHQIGIFTNAHVRSALVCWALIDDFAGIRTEHRVDIVDGFARLVLPEAIQGFELYLFDVSGAYYDHYSSRKVYLAPTNRAKHIRQRFTPSQESLLQDAGSGETHRVELKEWIPPTAEDTKYRELLKTVCAFANASGGRLYIGVRDDGQIVGVDQPLKRVLEKDARGDSARAREIYVRKLRQNIREGIEPALEANFNWIEHASRSVLCVHVPAGGEKPYQVIEGRQYFIRKNGRSVLAQPHEVEAMYAGRGQTMRQLLHTPGWDLA